MRGDFGYSVAVHTICVVESLKSTVRNLPPPKLESTLDMTYTVQEKKDMKKGGLEAWPAILAGAHRIFVAEGGSGYITVAVSKEDF